MVRWVFRHFPLSSIHSDAEGAARATECAHDQGMFHAYKEHLFANQSDLSLTALQQYATNIGLDRTAFDPCAAGSDRSR